MMISYKSEVTAFFFIISTISLSGSVYYISNKGNDSNSGKSIRSPWETISKVNRTHFKPGDIILFERNGIWHDKLNIRHSGTTARKIIYGAYGSGNKPIFDGKEPINSWDLPNKWIRVEKNIWRKEIEREDSRTRIWLNGIESKDCSLSIVTEELPWYIDTAGNYLYVYSQGCPATSYSKMEWNRDQIWLEAGEIDNITIQNLDIRAWRDGFRLNSCNYWVIENCNIGNGFALFGLVISGGSKGSSHGIIRKNSFDSGDRLMDNFYSKNCEDAINIRDNSNGWEVFYNTIKDWGHAGVYIVTYNGTYAIKNIKIHDNYFYFGDVDYGRAFCGDIKSLSQSSGNEFYNNLIEDQAVQSQIAVPYLKFYNNIFNVCRGKSYDSKHPDGNALMLSAYGGLPQYMDIHDNIFSYSNGFGIFLHNGEGYDEPYDINITGNKIINNIFYNNKGFTCGLSTNWIPAYTNFQIFIENLPSIHTNTYKNNTFHYGKKTKLVFYEGKSHSVMEFNRIKPVNSDIISGNRIGMPIINHLRDTTLFGSPPWD